MITVYQIKSNGWLGTSKEIDPREGVDDRWTYTAPPGPGQYQWVSGAWVAGEEPAEALFVGPDFIKLAEEKRADRDKALAETDWWVTKSIETGVPLTEEQLAYRQALRDLPDQEGFPAVCVMPVKPV